MIEAIIWDYDGTLVDTRHKNLSVTKEIVTEVLNKSFEEFPALSGIENYEKANTIAANWRTLYAREFNMNEDQIDYAGSLWTKYQLQNDMAVELYAGLPEVITELGNNYPQGIVSLNSFENIRRNLVQHKMETFFNVIIGYEEVVFSKQKPDPAALLKCIAHLNLSETNGIIVYIGDHETDALCAFNANHLFGKKKVISVAALYEKANSFESWKHQPDHVAYKTADITEIIKNIL